MNEGLRTAPEPLASEAREWIAPLTVAAGDSFRALYIYGSALAPDFDRERGNVNLLFVTLDLSTPRLIELATAVAKVKAQKVSWRFAPLVLDEEQVLRAADVFPNDFMDLSRRRAVLAGTDLLSSSTIDTDHMRYQCEYELRARLVGLRQAFLFHAGDSGKSREILAGAAQGASALYRHLLSLAGEPTVEDRAGLARAVGLRFGVSADALAAPWEARAEKVPAADAPARLAAYLDALSSLARAVDVFATR
jgi:sugar/nucleoside kinase (ribokinase family)